MSPSTPVLAPHDDVFSARTAATQRRFGATEGPGKQLATEPELAPHGLGITSGTTGSGLSKFLHFGRKTSDKSVKSTEVKRGAGPPLSPRMISGPTMQETQSLPMGFPLPPPPAPPSVVPTPAVRPLNSLPWAHASNFIAPHIAVPPSDSMSTITSSSSFASTALFTDDSESGSEATSMSLTSSPDSSSREGPPRMWKVKRAPEESPLRSTLNYASSTTSRRGSTPSRRHSADHTSLHSRNSTPVPNYVAAMLADPETPPRHKRASTSTMKPSPTSPPFNPLYERAVQKLRDSPESSKDADDELSPLRARENTLHSADKAFTSKTRIPSIRFEGISMDAVFAEVEAKLMGEQSTAPASDAEKRARRRTRVLSTYRRDSQGQFPSSSSSADSLLVLSNSSQSLATSASNSSIASMSTSSSMRSLEQRPLARPLPKRVSSRPMPLNIAAANSVPVWTSHTTAKGSPRSIHSVSTVGPSSPQMQSPLLSQTPSPINFTRPPQSPSMYSQLSPSPSLGDAFVHSPMSIKSPTFALPEVWIRPPTPTGDDERWVQPTPSPTTAPVAPSPPPIVSSPSTASVSSGAKVVIREEKRRVVLSSRSSRRPERRTFHEVQTPPHSPIFASPPLVQIENSPTQLFAAPSPIDHKRLSSSSQGSSGLDDDASDVEDALNNMLLKLNKPYTPPSSPHDVDDARRASFSSTYSTGSAYGGANWESEGIAGLALVGKGMTRSEESDDSLSRFGDAPLSLEAFGPLRVSPTPTQTPAVQVEEYRRENNATDVVYDELDDTDSAFETIEGTTTEEDDEEDVDEEEHVAQNLRIDLGGAEEDEAETSLGAAFVDIPVARKGSKPMWPSFDSIDSLSSLASSTTDSETDHEEVGIVMMGERVTCEYSASVGMAM